MNHIKRLKIKGFKSFANPTELTFEEGFNAIVGANGSGKSNVFDAMCFVLGRLSSKELRTEKLGNLVFNGGKNLKPAKEAEVSIFLDNKNKVLLNVEGDEIKISRIVKSSGDSTYYINENKVTRTEIIEILRKASINPDGYNIILQGDIAKVVNMSNVERRELIEEIANLSGYEEKRQKSLEKLEKVETDLKQADLLMEEKTKYLKELKSEKEQAEKYHETKEQLRTDNLLLVKAKLTKNEILKKKKEEELAGNEVILVEFKSKLEGFETETKKIDEKISEIEKTIEIKSHNDFISVTNRISTLESELKSQKEKKAETQKQIQELKSKLSGVLENIKTNKAQIKVLEQEISEQEKSKKEQDKAFKELSEKISSLKTNLNGESFKELEELEQKITEVSEKKYNKGLIQQDNAIQIEKLNTKLELLQQDLNKIEQNSASNKDQVSLMHDFRDKLKKLIIQITEKTTKNSTDSAKLNTLQNEYGELVEKHSKLRLRAESQNELIANNKAVDAIIKLKSKDSKIHGTIAELASVPDKYTLALETAIGKSVLNIVVEDDNTATKYINYLKENKIGNATFLPLNKINAKLNLDNSVLNKKGVIDYAINLVQFDKKYQNVFNLAFGDTLVIDVVESAKSIGIGQYRMITLDGDLVAKSGAMTGGYNARKTSIGAFKNEELTEKVLELEQKISSVKSAIDHLRAEKESDEKKIYEFRQQKMEIEGELAKLEKILSIGEGDAKQIQKEMETIISDKTVIENSLKKIGKDMKEFETELAKLQEKKTKILEDSTNQGEIITTLNAREQEKDKLREKLVEFQSKIDAKRIQISSVLKPEIEKMEKIVKETQESEERLKALIEEFNGVIVKYEAELKTNKEREKELSKDYKKYIDERDKLKEDKQKIQSKYEVEFLKFDKSKERSTTLRFTISEFETLNKTLNEELELLYANLKSEFTSVNEEGMQVVDESKIGEIIEKIETMLKATEIDVKELQNKVNNLKTKLNSFGSINMKAVEVYDKLNDEFNALLEKRETLTKEQREILEFVAEMDMRKKEKFMETYVKLKQNFVNYYKMLSTKGEAELEIEDEKNLFQSGVEIKVKLSQKTQLDIKSLSGGEKTITAVAFIFAIQEFNPASFYILDEIDAALDILNSEKLGKLIKVAAAKAQYIVVSHSEYLIQSSDVIYGVTMDKNKVSGVVSLDLRNMKEYVEQNLNNQNPPTEPKIE